VVIGERGVELATILIPDTVLAVFTTADDQVAGWIPVCLKHNAIMGLPLDLFVSRQGRNDN
jgi:hypothetical protein